MTDEFYERDTEDIESMAIDEDTAVEDTEDYEDIGVEADFFDDDDENEDPFILKLIKPYKFEGKTYTEVDLSGLERVNAKLMASVGKMMSKRKIIAAVPELTLEYSLFMAHRVTKLPIEFFERLPGPDAINLKNIVTDFLYGRDGED